MTNTKQRRVAFADLESCDENILDFTFSSEPGTSRGLRLVFWQGLSSLERRWCGRVGMPQEIRLRNRTQFFFQYLQAKFCRHTRALAPDKRLDADHGGDPFSIPSTSTNRGDFDVGGLGEHVEGLDVVYGPAAFG